MINAMKLTTIKAAQKRVDPPILVPDDGSMPRINSAPAAQVYWRTNQWSAKPEYLQFTGDIGIGLEMIQEQRRVIQSAFYEDLFTMLLNYEGPQMTATEVNERIEEKLSVFAPTWGRLQSELYDPLITRVVGILSRAGAYPDPPQELEKIDYDIEYKGKLAILLSATELRSINDMMTTIVPMAEINPEMLDWINFDEIPRFAAERHGVPPKFINPSEKVEEIRQARAEQQQMEQQAVMAAEMSKAVPNMQKASEPGSPLELLTNAAASGGLG